MAVNQVLQEVKRLNAMGRVAFGDPWQARRQVRADLHPSGFSCCLVTGGRFSSYHFESANGLDLAATAFERWAISQRLLKPGTAVILNYSSDSFKSSVLDVGPNKQFKRAAEADILARKDPAKLRKDSSGFAYRVVPSSGGRAELFELEIAQNDPASADTVNGLRVERYSSILSAVDFLVEHHGAAFGANTLLALVERTRVFYIALKKDGWAGMRVVPRSALGKVSEFRDTAATFSLQEQYNILVVSLVAGDTQEMISVCEAVVKDLGVDITLLTHEELVQATPELGNFEAAPFLPLALFRNGKSHYSIPFYSVREAMRPGISAGELFQINAFSKLRVLFFGAAVVVPLVAGYYYYSKSTTPEWNVNVTELAETEAEVQSLQKLEAGVKDNLAIVNSRLPFSDVLKVIYDEFPGDLKLDSIRQEMAGSDKIKGSQWRLQIAGTGPETAESIIQSYTQQMGERANRTLAAYSPTVRLTDSSVVPGGGSKKNRQFRIEMLLVTREIKPEVPVATPALGAPVSDTESTESVPAPTPVPAG